MSSSGRRRFLLRRPKVVDVGCSCRGTKLSSLFTFHLPRWKPKPNYTPTHHHHNPLSSYYASSSSCTTAATSPWAATSHKASSLSTATTSFYGEDTSSSYSRSTWAWNQMAGTPKTKKKPARGSDGGGGGGGGTWAGDSVAVVKESDDPYLDFRESMLQMILEKEIYAWGDLLELLNSFLALNAPCHHDLIFRAFAEICGGAFSSSEAPSGYSAYTAGAAMHSQHGRSRRRQHGAGGRQRPHHALT